MKAIILAGGFGTRLSTVIGELPKPMAPVAGRPFLCWLLDYMAEQGVREVTLCLHHMAAHIKDFFAAQYGIIKINYSIEETPLGTGGAIYKALGDMKPEGPVFVLNGDSIVQLNYHRMMQYHLSTNAPLTIASHEVPNCSRYSKLTISNNKITHYALLGDHHPAQASVGFYIISPTLFDPYEVPEAFSFERDFLADHVPELGVNAYPLVDYFIDIGVPQDYERATMELPALMLA